MISPLTGFQLALDQKSAGFHSCAAGQFETGAKKFFDLAFSGVWMMIFTEHCFWFERLCVCGENR